MRHELPEVPSLTKTFKRDENTGERVVESTEVEDGIATERSITAQDCLDDIKDLAQKNPDKLISRDFYRKNGTIRESEWTAHFGTYAEFQRAAGLNLSRSTTKIRNQVAKHAANDELRSVSATRFGLDKLYERDNKKRFKTMVAVSDLHDIECDPFYLRVLGHILRDVEPDVVCLDGDIFDLPEFGKYHTDPREWDVVKRMQYGVGIIKGIRESAPNAQIDLIEGNHEARIVKHLVEASPVLRHVLSGIHGFDLQKLFCLDKYEVNYVCQADLHNFSDAQLKKEVEARNYKLYWGCVMANHFPHGRHQGVPGFHGHHHQHLVWTMHNANFGSYEWHQLGAGHIRTAPYCDGTKWNNGFLIVMADTETKSVQFDYVSIGTTFAMAAGRIYYREPHEFYPALETELDIRGGL